MMDDAFTETKSSRAESVDLNSNGLNGDDFLKIEISDALNEKEKVKFTVKTKTNLKTFSSSEFSVIREHEEFIWLHDRFVENDEFAGYIIPPAPPRPDFDSSREKLQRLTEGESSMTKEEFNKMKQELESEYLALFKKTVQMHEVFLHRLSSHPVLKNDTNLRIFLEYTKDLNVRSKNTKERFGGLVKSISKNADELRLLNQKETDEYFDGQKKFLTDYHNKIRDDCVRADRMTYVHKSVADCYIRVSYGLSNVATAELESLSKFLTKISDYFETTRKTENRVSSDTDLKLSDTLRYYVRDSKAALDLLYRRTKRLADFENENKNLERARQKHKDEKQAELAQQNAKQKFEQISEIARGELADFKTRRNAMFKKSLTDFVEIQLKHSNAQVQTLRNLLETLKE
ncbi:unnamed protein product [Brachionus calyciflorus]|uniref:Sorting nexin n=1 Tax=Brachionus calyciflorus TaxID=104777 RepID=A0A813XP34_9BILA|nr:unnamed protein product [Brachionus calyciflorus]